MRSLMTQRFVREDPPSRSSYIGNRLTWEARLLELTKKKKKEWYRLCVTTKPQTAHTTAFSLRRKAAKMPGKWEFTSRGRKVYGRFVSRPYNNRRPNGRH